MEGSSRNDFQVTEFNYRLEIFFGPGLIPSFFPFQSDSALNSMIFCQSSPMDPRDVCCNDSKRRNPGVSRSEWRRGQWNLTNRHMQRAILEPFGCICFSFMVYSILKWPRTRRTASTKSKCPTSSTSWGPPILKAHFLIPLPSQLKMSTTHQQHPHPSSTTIQPGEVHAPATPGCVRFGSFVAPIGEPKNPELVPTPMREKRWVLVLMPPLC